MTTQRRQLTSSSAFITHLENYEERQLPLLTLTLSMQLSDGLKSHQCRRVNVLMLLSTGFHTIFLMSIFLFLNIPNIFLNDVAHFIFMFIQNDQHWFKHQINELKKPKLSKTRTSTSLFKVQHVQWILTIVIRTSKTVYLLKPCSKFSIPQEKLHVFSKEVSIYYLGLLDVICTIYNPPQNISDLFTKFSKVIFFCVTINS